MENSLSSVEFAANPERRCPVVLVLDTSGSMAGESIASLNHGLQVFEQGLRKDTLASLRVEIAVVTFGDSARVVDVRGSGSSLTPETAFVTIDNFQMPHLMAEGSTPMGPAVNLALDLIQDRKELYKRHGIGYYRPWILLVSDGAPDPGWESSANRAKAEEQRKGVDVYPVGVDYADFGILSQFSKNQPLRMSDHRKFGELFQWLSDSMSAIANSQPGQQVPLPSTSGWATYTP